MHIDVHSFREVAQNVTYLDRMTGTFYRDPLEGLTRPLVFEAAASEFGEKILGQMFDEIRNTCKIYKPFKKSFFIGFHQYGVDDEKRINKREPELYRKIFRLDIVSKEQDDTSFNRLQLQLSDVNV